MIEDRWKPLARAWPFLVLAVLAVVFTLMLIFSRKAPVIDSVEPAMASPGQQVVILGDYFGRTEREGSLNLAGEIPPPSLIEFWSDQKIVFQVPEDASSGLVTVSNSQGTSTGILFTNTASIPTVLQPASAPGAPLLTAVVPSQPQSGQLVTITGRGFSAGDRKVLVRLTTGKGGPVFEILPSDCVVWSDRSLSFRWPAGAGPSSTVQVSTPQGKTPEFALEASSPLILEDPLSLDVEVRIWSTIPFGASGILWGPVPQSLSGTAWVLAAAQPAPLAGTRPLVFRWTTGSVGEKRVAYSLTLTSWARRWQGFTAGTTVSAGDAPRGDDRPLDWWKSSAQALKALTSPWGLETPDPWLRIQRIQTGLTSAFKITPESSASGGLARTPAQILASGTLDSLEASSLAVVLAGLSGVPVRLVSGLWLNRDDAVVSRVWNEAWFQGAGWVPWDVVDGSPGNLDNRHFAFETGYRAAVRLEPRAKTLGQPAPFSQGEPAGETAWTEQEPTVKWEVKRTEK